MRRSASPTIGLDVLLFGSCSSKKPLRTCALCRARHKAHYLERVFMLSCGPAGQRRAVTAAEWAPHNSRLRVAIRRRVGERQCRSPCEHCRASRRISGSANGVRLNCPAAPCIRRAAARLPAMAVTPGRRHGGCGSLDGTALRAAERSASCRTSSPPGSPACSPRSRKASLSHRRPGA